MKRRDYLTVIRGIKNAQSEFLRHATTATPEELTVVKSYIEILIANLCQAFKEDNPTFQQDKFDEAYEK